MLRQMKQLIPYIQTLLWKIQNSKNKIEIKKIKNKSCYTF